MRPLYHFWSVVRKYDERHDSWFIIDAVSDNQYMEIVAPQSTGKPVPVPNPSSVNNGRLELAKKPRYIKPFIIRFYCFSIFNKN